MLSDMYMETASSGSGISYGDPCETDSWEQPDSASEIDTAEAELSDASTLILGQTD